MLSTCLLALAFPSGVPTLEQGHAHLHTAQADFYIEVPALEQVRAQYSQAPFWAMLHSEEFSSLLEGITGSPTDVRSLVASMWESSGVPPELLSENLEAWRSCTAISLSVAGIGEALESTVPQALALQEVRRETSFLRFLLMQSRAEGSELPTLESLSITDDARRKDPWGRTYSLIQKGAEFQLGTLGRDGAEGGTGLDADYFLQSDGTPSGDSPSLHIPIAVQLVLEFDEPAIAERLSEQLHQLHGEESSTEGNWRRTSLGGDPALHHWFTRRGNLCVLGAGDFDPAAADARLGAPSDSSETSTPFASLQAKLDPPAGTIVQRGYRAFSIPAVAIRGAGALARAEGEAQAVGLLETLAAAVGDPSASRVAWRTDFAEERFTTHTYSQSTPSAEGTWLGAQPLGASWKSLVPPEAILAYGTTVDGKVLARLLVSLLGSVEGLGQQGVEKTLSGIEESTGIRLREDLFDNLGPDMVAYLLPLSIGIPQVHVDLTVRNPEAVQRALNVLVGMLEGQAAGMVRVERREYRDIEVVSLVPEVAGMVSVEPSFAIADGRLLFSLKALHVRREIKRLMAGGDMPAHPVLSQAIPKAQDLTSFFVLDWEAALGGIYAIAKSFGPMAGQFLGREIDTSGWPSVSALMSYLSPTIRSTRPVSGGTYTKTVSPFGPEMPFLLGSTALAFGYAAQAPGGMFGPDLQPREIRAPIVPFSPEESTQSALQELRNGLAVYRIDQGSYPERLGELLQGTPGFPQGFLESGLLPSDGWGRSFHYERGEDGASYRLWSAGSDGVNQQGEGDDVSTAP